MHVINCQTPCKVDDIGTAIKHCNFVINDHGLVNRTRQVAPSRKNPLI